MDQHLAKTPTQVSSTRPRAGNNKQSINPDPVQLRRSSRRLQSSSGTWRRYSVIVYSSVGNVTEPARVQSYFRVFHVFTFLSFVLFPFLPYPQFLVPPSLLSLQFPVPRLISLSTHISQRPADPRSFASTVNQLPRTLPQLPALHSLRRNYTPASFLRVPRFQVSFPRSSGTLDRAPSVTSICSCNN